MRGLSLAGILIALAFVGYLQVDNSRNKLRDDGRVRSALDTATQVETEIEAATEQHMQNLKELSNQ